MISADLGVHNIKEGENLITLRCSDKFIIGEKGTVFGLDYLSFERK